ncbi:type VI secretion system protein TssA [Rheinheimera salexigens]|uniref:Type VI secretion protein n=1 Tax=Rheinheimera salexigens TaxID=1628148 RepID=A0A1E7Q6K7_9GAMM|nr:type VI secretion system protein TssA [Rheinheimera salexigens]OEY69740.1 type VI secretion protein [Rheinheimera salexigens]
MLLSDQINFELLTTGVSDDAPSGVDPRFDISPTSQYYQLKDIRGQARAQERAMLAEDDDFQSLALEWRPLSEQLPAILNQQVKDLEYSAWMIEALCRTDGFYGLAQSFKATRLLIEYFWQHLYPSPDEDGLESRIAPLIGLNGYEGDGALITPILSIPLTEQTDAGEFACWQYQRAADISRKDEKRQQLKAEAGIASIEQIKQAVASSSSHFYQNLMQQINAAISEFELLAQAMDSAMADQPQPTSAISATLIKCRDAVNYLAADKLQSLHVIDADETIAGSDYDHDKSQLAVNSLQQQIQSREQVLRSLKQAAEFFRQTEPHSPISYALEQVLHWSGLSLPELLQEMMDDSSSRNQFFRLAGIPQQST